MSGHKPIILHGTDLFHAFNDPDDHWDLAVQYGLANMGFSSLRGIFIDAPIPKYGDPSIMSVGQLNAISGQAVTATVGCQKKIITADDFEEALNEGRHNSSVRMILDTLREATQPVNIQICGSSRDVAIAGNLEPELFSEKCGAIYLNAGACYDKELIEYNVSIEPYSYKKIFDIPCNIFWLPCFEYMPGGPEFDDSSTIADGVTYSKALESYNRENWRNKRNPYAQHGTYFRFSQREMFEHCSENLKKYFVYALGRVMDMGWYSYLKLPLNKGILDYHASLTRNAWGFPAIFHSANAMVEKDGSIVKLQDSKDPVFGFQPVKVNCDDDGHTDWYVTDDKTNIYIYYAPDPVAYETAIVKAIGTCIDTLP